MTDIVERLREVAERPDANYPAIMEQAADEITRLRAALRDALSYSTIGDMPVTIYENARAALGGR